MEDSGAQQAPSAAASAAPPNTSSSESAPPPAEPAGGDVFGDLPADQPLFPRSYVERVRTEGAKYRTEARTHAEQLAEYQNVFGVYEDADRQEWLNLARTWAVDPNQAAKVMDQIARAVLDEASTGSGGGDGDRPPDTPATLAETTGLTPEQVQSMIADAMAGRDQAAAEQKVIEDIYGEVRAHGYEPDSREGFMVLWTANNETDGDIDAAVERIHQYRQSIIDDYVNGRANGNQPTPSSGNGVPASQHQPIESFEDARRAADAFIRAQAGAATPS